MLYTHWKGAREKYQFAYDVAVFMCLLKIFNWKLHFDKKCRVFDIHYAARQTEKKKLDCPGNSDKYNSKSCRESSHWRVRKNVAKTKQNGICCIGSIGDSTVRLQLHFSFFAYKVILSCLNGFSTIVLYTYKYRLTIAINKILNVPPFHSFYLHHSSDFSRSAKEKKHFFFIGVVRSFFRLFLLPTFFSLFRNSFAYLCSVIYFGMNAH